MARTLKCPYCGSTFEVPETASIAVCPYCGATVWAATGQEFKEHYMFNLTMTANRAFDAVRGVAQRQFAAPDDLADAMSPKAFFLHFVPLYLYHIKVRAECPGNPDAGLEEGFRVVLAMRSPPEGLGSDYAFPVRGRVFFKPSLLERGRYHQPDLDPKEIMPRIVEKARAKAVREALNECSDPALVDESRWAGIIHYPFWEVVYTYAGKEYKGLVDGADGRVVYLEYPIGGKERGVLLALGIGGLAAAALIGAGIGAALGHSFAAAGGAGGFIASLPGAALSLRLGAARRGVYRLRSRLSRRG